jgi:tetratricopeptide (TPR) repeat protein
MLFAGRFSEAVELKEKALRLNPFPTGSGFRGLATAYRLSGRYEEAVAVYKKALELEPNDLFAHLGLTIAYVKMGLDEQAKAKAEEILRIHPKFSSDYLAKVNPFGDKSVVDDAIACLRKAGLQ